MRISLCALPRVSVAAFLGALSISGFPDSRAGAQELTHVAIVDSANAARAAWARAVAAMQKHADSTARREAARAAKAWPTQSGYVWGVAMLAARANDTVTALRALRDYANLGLGRDLRTDTSVARLLSAPGFAAVLAEHDANRAPLVRSQVRARLADSTFWPEGVDVDPRTHRYYVASIRHRTIAEIRPDGTSRELIARDRPDLGAIFGVRFDARRGVLWATTSGVRQTEGYVAADSAIGALLKIRVADGTIERRWDVPVRPGGHVLGDLAIGPAGDVYVTDSNEPVLYRLRPGADTLEAIRNPLFHNLQGMAPTPDGKFVYVSDYSHGLLRVDLNTRAVIRLADAPHSTSLGCDGIAWDRGAIIAVQNGVVPSRITRFVLDKTGTRIVAANVIDRNFAVADEPAIGTVVNGEFVYVANGQWEKYDDDGKRVATKPLTAPILLAVPIVTRRARLP